MDGEPKPTSEGNLVEAYLTREEIRIHVTNPGPTINCSGVAGGATVEDNIIDWCIRRWRVTTVYGVGQVVQQEDEVKSCQTWSECGRKICVAH